MTFYLMSFLILFPLIASALMLVLRKDKTRSIATCLSAAIIIIASLALAVPALFSNIQEFAFESEICNWISFGLDVLLSLLVAFYAIKHKRFLAFILSLLMIAANVYIEFTILPGVESISALYIDRLSAIMTLIIGIVGSLICVYAIGYMRDFKANELKKNPNYHDRSHKFFAIMFAFLSAMFVIVFSDNMSWMLTGWETTAVASFALIAYTKTGEAIHNAFVQIEMNIFGGLAFAVALILIGMQANTLSLAELIDLGSYGMLLLPVGLLCLSSLVKSAQMPFQSWLLGAMVAPTPTSALLHSSTMVKAGVFMLIKLSPCLGGNAPGLMVVIVGATTFIIASAAAISQSDAKRVLAYSTISNLGLIALCAGIGTAEATWAAVFLTVFHACTKALLFICVGTAQHRVGSRNIENMDELFEAAPVLAKYMAIGIIAMVVAPFGMLVSKWAAMIAVADAGHIAVLAVIAFGSAMVFFFWAKWLGKLSAIADEPGDKKAWGSKSERLAIKTDLAIVIGCCVLLPILSQAVVVPYVVECYGWYVTEMGIGTLFIVSAISVLIIAAYLIFYGRSNKPKANIFLSGAAVDYDKREFLGSRGEVLVATHRNLYMADIFPEGKLSKIGYAVTIFAFVAAAGICVWTGGVVPWF